MAEQTCEGRLSNAALAILITGVIITAASFMWPIDFDYAIDPTLSAAENEKRQLQNDRSNFLIGVMSLVGMSLVTFGGLVTSALFCKNVVMDEYHAPGYLSARSSRPGLSGQIGAGIHLRAAGVQRQGDVAQLHGAGTQLHGPGTQLQETSLAVPGRVQRVEDLSAAKSYGTLDNPK